jgi:hypothetical protein
MTNTTPQRRPDVCIRGLGGPTWQALMRVHRARMVDNPHYTVRELLLPIIQEWLAKQK